MRGCMARKIRWAKKRLMMKMMRTPAATKMEAAMARLMFEGREVEAMRRVLVTVRAMQNTSRA